MPIKFARLTSDSGEIRFPGRPMLLNDVANQQPAAVDPTCPSSSPSSFCVPLYLRLCEDSQKRIARHKPAASIYVGAGRYLIGGCSRAGDCPQMQSVVISVILPSDLVQFRLIRVSFLGGRIMFCIPWKVAVVKGRTLGGSRAFYGQADYVVYLWNLRKIFSD
jgi:hypothetical protein